MEFTPERNDELLRVYRKCLSQCAYIDNDKVMQQVVNSPASRFWVSEERAWMVVLQLRAGKPALEGMLPNKREMFQEIYDRYCALAPQHPQLNSLDVVSMVVNSPAPKFYMSAKTAAHTLYLMRRSRK